MFSVVCVLVSRLIAVISFLCALVASALATPQQAGPAISKDRIYVQTVQRGSMPLREVVGGPVTSLTPARVTVSLCSRQTGLVKIGQPSSVQLHPPEVTRGKVGHLMRNSDGTVSAELYLDSALPAGTSVGDGAAGSIEVDGDAPDVVFVGRAADARPNTASTIFRVDADGTHARRVPVKYGRQSGVLIEVLSGLSPGDKVIVSDMSPYAGLDRVTLK